MWQIAPGFEPDIGMLSDETLQALVRMGELVAGKGGMLQVTSAYRPEGRGLHGAGKAVDVWVPGWEHEKIASVGQQAGFLGGYIPKGKSFVELVTGQYTYKVPGEVFGFEEEPELDIELELRKKMEDTGAFEKMREGEKKIAEGLLESLLPEIDFTRSIAIGVVVLLFVILLIVFVKSV